MLKKTKPVAQPWQEQCDHVFMDLSILQNSIDSISDSNPDKILYQEQHKALKATSEVIDKIWRESQSSKPKPKAVREPELMKAFGEFYARALPLKEKLLAIAPYKLGLEFIQSRAGISIEPVLLEQSRAALLGVGITAASLSLERSQPSGKSGARGLERSDLGQVLRSSALLTGKKPFTPLTPKVGKSIIPNPFDKKIHDIMTAIQTSGTTMTTSLMLALLSFARECSSHERELDSNASTARLAKRAFAQKLAPISTILQTQFGLGFHDIRAVVSLEGRQLLPLFYDFKMVPNSKPSASDTDADVTAEGKVSIGGQYLLNRSFGEAQAQLFVDTAKQAVLDQTSAEVLEAMNIADKEKLAMQQAIAFLAISPNCPPEKIHIALESPHLEQGKRVVAALKMLKPEIHYECTLDGQKKEESELNGGTISTISSKDTLMHQLCIESQRNSPASRVDLLPAEDSRHESSSRLRM